MAKRVGVDKWLYSAVVLLTCIGPAMVFSASAVMAQQRYGSAYTFFLKQAAWAVLGLICMTAFMQVDYRRYNNKRLIYVLVGLTLALLAGVFLLPGSHATHRWIRFGGFFTFQPSEIAKPVLVLYLAWFLHSRTHTMEDWRNTLLPAVIPPLLFIGLIVKEPDLGTALVCAGVTALLLYLAGIQLRFLGMALIGAAPLLYLLLFRVAFRRARMLAFLNPDSDPQGSGFHINQSLIAVGTGGFTGRGYMEGLQKLFYLPEPHTDFIFANIAEEMGLVGTIFLLLLFAFVGYRGMRAAVLSSDPFARFLAFGITSTVLIQAFFNISVVISLLPTKGIPLPFISSGGTSLFFMLVSMGILLNITREND